MKEHTLEWIEKAEEDFRVAEWIIKAPAASPAATAFHCQQCIEKWMKAILVEKEREVPKTHDLILLANLLTPVVSFGESTREILRTMTMYAVEHRYPGLMASPEDAAEAMESCRELRRRLRTILGLAEA